MKRKPKPMPPNEVWIIEWIIAKKWIIFTQASVGYFYSEPACYKACQVWQGMYTGTKFRATCYVPKEVSNAKP
jgi:hypothetical protein